MHLIEFLNFFFNFLIISLYFSYFLFLFLSCSSSSIVVNRLARFGELAWPSARLDLAQPQQGLLTRLGVAGGRRRFDEVTNQKEEEKREEKRRKEKKNKN